MKISVLQSLPILVDSGAIAMMLFFTTMSLSVYLFAYLLLN